MSRNALIALVIALGLAVVAQNAEMRSISRSDAGSVVDANGGQAGVTTGSAGTVKDGSTTSRAQMNQQAKVAAGGDDQEALYRGAQAWLEHLAPNRR
jgi:hypothetical protein